MNKKIWIYIAMISVVIMFFIIGCYSWFLKQQPRILTGTAKAHFPYTDYSKAELEKMYPQTMYENVTTTQSPEQTHVKFITALKKGDFDEATKCCFLEENFSKAKNTLEQIRDKGYLEKMIKDLEVMDKEMLLDTKATYSYFTMEGSEKIGHSINFIKDKDGIWRITSL